MTDRFQVVLNRWGREFMETRSENYQRDHAGHRMSQKHDMTLDGDRGWIGSDVTPGDPASFWLVGECECGRKVFHDFNSPPQVHGEPDELWVIRELVNTEVPV